MQVEPQDWQAALESSPAPCSLRSGMACLAPAAGPALPSGYLAPLLMPTLAMALHSLRLQAWPLPPASELAAQLSRWERVS